ncbi:MAG: hypothetical protein GC168_15765, partial [Candidatus Hydrogenedens sp.]|nr:hypothetical protein [Candidatus Hydrogenedens sp.]
MTPYTVTRSLRLVDNTGSTQLLQVSYNQGETVLGFTAAGVVGSTGYFAANTDGNGYQIWTTDGTPGGTVPLFDSAEVEYFDYARDFYAFAGRLWFGGRKAGGAEGLWTFDPVNNTFAYIAAIIPGWENALAASGRLYFEAEDGVTGVELYVTDGTIEGTRILGDINPGAGDANPGVPVAHDGMLYFAADHCAYGRELWGLALPDGAPALIADLNPGQASGFCTSGEIQPTALYFAGSTPETGCELWKIVLSEVIPEGEGGGEATAEGGSEGAAEGQPEGAAEGSGEEAEVAPDGEGAIDGDGGEECPAGNAADADLLGEWRLDCDRGLFNQLQETWTFRHDGTFTRARLLVGDESQQSESSGTYSVNTAVTPHEIDFNFCQYCVEDIFEEYEECDWCCTPLNSTGVGLYSIDN